MRITGKGCVLHGPEGVSPPLPYIVVSREEGLDLIERGFAIAIDGLPDETVVIEEIPAAATQSEAADDAAADEVVITPAASISEDLVEALDLIEDDDLVKTGPRAGKPKAGAVKEIIGRDVTTEEIDAAWAARS